MSAANGSNLGARLSQMELSPAWARWGALTVAYGLLAASFWLMIRDGQLMKLLGLAVFAVGLPFLVYLGRAVGREHDRDLLRMLGAGGGNIGEAEPHPPRDGAHGSVTFRAFEG